MFWEIYATGLLVIIAAMFSLWLLSLLVRDASIVDIFWGPGFVITGWYYFFVTDGDPLRKGIMVLLVTIWGLRLGIYLAHRNLGKGEDFRYARWRRNNGQKWWWLSFFRVFLLQGIVMWLVSAPLLAAQIATQPAAPILTDILGIVVWLVGFIFEAGGDWQLMRFKADESNKGKVLNTGFWRYTRHPNYFGDAVQWWGFYLIALGGGGAATILSPVLMTFFLMRVSGVVMLEKSLKKSRPGYEDYIQNTSAFIPMPPRQSGTN